MYELNGQQFSLEQVTNAAKQSNMDLDAYLEKAGMVKLNDPVKEAAVAGSENTSSTDSTSDPGSSELEKINNIRKKFGNKNENVISELNEEDEKKLREHIAITSGSDFNYDEIAKSPTGAGILGSGTTGLAGTASMVDLVGGVGTAVTSVAT